MQSNRPGLGANLITNEMIKHYVNYPCNTFSVLNRFDGRLVDFVPQRYYIRKILPSRSDFFNITLRRNFDCLCDLLRQCSIYSFPFFKDAYKQFLVLFQPLEKFGFHIPFYKHGRSYDLQTRIGLMFNKEMGTDCNDM